ncbi:peptide chain release factor N(5)-glutamine methyltransferase [Coriobacteriia bacterium Es71-Z0120]|uniref:peptide chain release factor N(5)-glutamine methyltransferase n=1 Tax=Parvivirga hydrogeniphila TaxID=2939460 RepID=UPI0022609B57|nr:peptide chain release factor N(5)-glutamine methyltransferase [Parvivirga hydrogeniphila]MCL4078764.1 peptide chain release factor N(5)-glutamine methyltransferase [Parvivirga hydrogeniphila]
MAERVWTVRDALEWIVGYLQAKGDEQPRRSAEWLLSAATGLSRVEVYAYHDRPLSPDERAYLRSAVRRRAAGEPLQIVTGEMPFRHLVIRVRPGVFIPRPETEVLVEVAVRALGDVEQPLVAEPCTGSGCVAASIAHELPGARVVATDVSETAVDTARQNALYAKVDDRVQVLHGDLLEPVLAQPSSSGAFDAVVSNPPYVPRGELADLPEEVARHEPRAALDGGEDGCEVARRIVRQAIELLKPGGFVALELAEDRASAFAEEISAVLCEVAVVKDLTGRDRIVVGKKREASGR